MSQLIISVSGLRGVVGESLSPLEAIRYVAAFVADLPPGPIVIGRDGRSTGPMLAAALSAGLTAAGRDVLDAGVASTPTVGVLVRSVKAAGGIQISASHNPPEYNGLKLFSAAGRVLPAIAGKLVLNRYEQSACQWAAFDRVGRQAAVVDTTTAHLGLILSLVNVPAIRRRNFRVLLDANHGSGSVLGTRLLEALGLPAHRCSAARPMAASPIHPSRPPRIWPACSIGSQRRGSTSASARIRMRIAWP